MNIIKLCDFSLCVTATSMGTPEVLGNLKNSPEMSVSRGVDIPRYPEFFLAPKTQEVVAI